MTSIVCRLSLLLALTLTAGAALADETPEPDAGVVATVNGEPIFLEDVERHLGDLHSQVGEVRRGDFDLDHLMFRLVNDELLAQEARALGMDEEEPIPSRLAEMRRRLAVERLELEEIWKPVTVTDEEVRQEFAERYRRVTLRIVTTHEKAEAEAALARARAGEDLEALARELSVDPYGPRGGLGDSLPRADLQLEVAEVAFGLEPGELAGPVQTSIGWSLIRVESFAEPEEERFEEVRRDLFDVLRYRKSEELRARLSEVLAERHPVELDAQAVAAVGRERLPDGRLMPVVPDPQAVVVRVGTHPITAEEYGRALMRRWTGVRNEAAAEAVTPMVLDRLVGETLLLAEALDRGYDRAPEVERQVRARETELLVKTYLEEVVASAVEVEREEMEAFYEEHREDYRRPARVRLGQITVETEEKAEEMARLLRAGTDLAWLARQHSIDRLKDSGGDRGWFDPTPGVDEFNDRLLEAEAGEVIGPFGTPGNFTVMRVSAREPRGHYGFEEVSGNVRQALFNAGFTRILDETLSKLRSRSEIVVHDDVLAVLSITGSHQEGSDAGPDPGH